MNGCGFCLAQIIFFLLFTFIFVACCGGWQQYVNTVFSLPEELEAEPTTSLCWQLFMHRHFY